MQQHGYRIHQTYMRLSRHAGRESHINFIFVALFCVTIWASAYYFDYQLRLSQHTGDIGVLTTTVFLVLFIPFLGTSIRRRHDTGKSMLLIPALATSILMINGLLISWFGYEHYFSILDARHNYIKFIVALSMVVGTSAFIRNLLVKDRYDNRFGSVIE